MTQRSIDIEQVAKDWASNRYDELADRSQRRLKNKELRSPGSHLVVRVDWTDVRFRDDTKWLRLAEDTFDEETRTSSDEDTPPKKTPSERADLGLSHANVLFRTQFTNNTKLDQEYNMHVEKSTSSTATTEIEHTFTRGMEVSVKLASPCEVFEANAGYTRELSISNVEGEAIEEQLTWGADSQIKVSSNHLAEAELVVDEKKYEGDFKIFTRISGQVYVEFRDRKNNKFIMSMAKDFHKLMKDYLEVEQRKGEPVDQYVEIKGNTVTIITKGKCNFRYGIKQEVRVKQTALNAL